MCVWVRDFCFTPPILAAVCGVCAWVRVLTSSRQSLLWCGVCVFGCVFGYPTPILDGVWDWGLCARSACTPPFRGWGLRCVCSGAGFGFTSPILVAVWVVCVCVHVLRLAGQS